MSDEPLKHTAISCQESDEEQYIQKWLNTEQAAQYLGVTTKALHNLNSLGRVPYFKFGRSNRYLATELDHLLKQKPRGNRHGNKED